MTDRLDPHPALLPGSRGIGQAVDQAGGAVGHVRPGIEDTNRRVGRYEVVEVIGRGGAAVVYLAYQPDLHRQVALKELAPFCAAEREFAERFLEESRMIATLNHPNVVTVHEYFEDAGVPYIAMEYLARGSLRPLIGRLVLAEIVGVLDSALAGLAHGEGHGLVHRDLKPENLLVTDDGRVKITDFGVARAINNATPRAVVTAAGTTIGTPAYMAPELALGGTLSPATDLYSLGIVAWELLTGRVPFQDSGNPAEVLYRQVYEEVPPVEAVVPRIDQRLAEWLGRMLRKRPEDRFQSAQGAWDRLEDIGIEMLGPRWRRLTPLAARPTDVDRARSTPPAFVAAPSLPAVGAAPAGGGLRGAPRRRVWSRLRSSSVPAEPANEPLAAPSSSVARMTLPRTRRRGRSHEATSDLEASAVVPASGSGAPVVKRRTRRAGWPPIPGGRDHGPRAWWIALVAGVVLATVLAAILATELLPTTTHPRAVAVVKHDRKTTPPPAVAVVNHDRKTTPPPAVAVVKHDVSRLNAIVELFISGKRLSHVEHRYAAAAANRRLVLERLMALHPPRPLRAAAQTLTQMTADSLSFNDYMARGETALAHAPDVAHNALRPRFVDEFNPYARRYLALTYKVGDL